MAIAKDLINGLLGLAGLRVCRINAAISIDERIDILSKAIFDQFKTKGTTFLQVGGYDGRSNDPIWEFVGRYGWRGVICEPHPEAFARLRSNYGGRENVALVNKAVSHDTARRKLYYVRRDGTPLPEWAYQVSSFHADLFTRERTGITGVEGLVDECCVECVALMDLIRDYQLNNLDILQIDVEGYDFEILKMIDFGVVTPKVIRYEHKHLSGTDKAASASLLVGHGYHLIFERSDAVAFLGSGQVGTGSTTTGMSSPTEATDRVDRLGEV